MVFYRPTTIIFPFLFSKYTDELGTILEKYDIINLNDIMQLANAYPTGHKLAYHRKVTRLG